MAEQKKTVVGILSVAAVIVAIVIIAGGGSNSSDKNEEDDDSFTRVRASISFTGSAFKVTNNDADMWTDVEMAVNGVGLSLGYRYKTARMNPGVTYTIQANQFVKSNGERFDPDTHKPVKFEISCTVRGGSKGYAVLNNE